MGETYIPSSYRFRVCVSVLAESVRSRSHSSLGVLPQLYGAICCVILRQAYTSLTLGCTCLPRLNLHLTPSTCEPHPLASFSSTRATFGPLPQTICTDIHYFSVRKSSFFENEITVRNISAYKCTTQKGWMHWREARKCTGEDYCTLTLYATRVRRCGEER